MDFRQSELESLCCLVSLYAGRFTLICPSLSSVAVSTAEFLGSLIKSFFRSTKGRGSIFIAH